MQPVPIQPPAGAPPPGGPPPLGGPPPPGGPQIMPFPAPGGPAAGPPVIQSQAEMKAILDEKVRTIDSILWR